MEFEFVEKLVRLFEQSTLGELDLTEDGRRLRLVKGRSPELSTITDASASAGFAAVSATIEHASTAHVIAASLSGVFYRRATPDQPAFVAVGDLIEEGQPLALMEAMKLLVKIEADRAGRVLQIMCEDGESVQAGTALFLIEPSA